MCDKRGKRKDYIRARKIKEERYEKNDTGKERTEGERRERYEVNMLG